MGFDILVIEKGDGGEFVVNKNRTDIITVTGFQNMVYLALFGGNVDQSTKQYLKGEQRFDWWGNTALFRSRPTAQMNSSTERTLREVVLTSNGRLIIEQAVKSDLKFMEDFAEVKVFVSLELNDRVRIKIELIQPKTDTESELTFIWDKTNNELINNNQYVTV